MPGQKKAPPPFCTPGGRVALPLLKRMAKQPAAEILRTPRDDHESARPTWDGNEGPLLDAGQIVRDGARWRPVSRLQRCTGRSTSGVTLVAAHPVSQIARCSDSVQSAPMELAQGLDRKENVAGVDVRTYERSAMLIVGNG